MARRLLVIAVGEVLVLAGGYFLVHDLFGFVLPALSFDMPQITWPDVSAAIRSGLAMIDWGIVWPAVAVVVGAMLISSERPRRLRTH